MANVKPESASNVKFVGYSDQGGRPDGVQVMVNKGYAFISQPFSGGWSEAAPHPSPGSTRR